MSKSVVLPKDALQHPIFQLIGKVGHELGQEVYVVGGFVRDQLLQRTQPKDIDFVTIGSGIALAKAVSEKLGPHGKVTVFKNFGTAMIHHAEYELEFVGARKESYDLGSRKPTVENGSLEDDQKRRDFTINALAISLNPDSYGELIDPFGGLLHLEEGILKTPLDPDSTFSDDPLRMMRAIRFANQLHFSIEAEALSAIRRNADRMQILSAERITEEFMKIMRCDKPSIGLGLLYETKLIHRFLPEIAALQGVEEIEGKLHKDNFYHTLEVVDNVAMASQNVWLRWAALLHDIGKPVVKRFDKKVGWTFHSHEFVGGKMTPAIFRRLKLPLGEPLRYVKKIVQQSSRPIVLSQEEVTDSAVRRLLFDAGDELEDLMILCESDITTKNSKKKSRYLKNFENVRQKLKEVEESDAIRNWQPPISGEQIMEVFGISPGREIGIIKNAIRESILDGIIPNKEKEAFEYMLQIGKEIGLKPKESHG